ncbi:MAG: hypothetical protein JWR02_2492 [Mucilaginibacter sp.]|nr:hypothetical protein [Mucilaginibacter sp.]
MTLKQWWLTVAFPILFFSASVAQTISVDSLQYNKAAAKAVDLYNEQIAGQSEIYNGTAYESPAKATKGSVYFQDKNYFTAGIIRYNNTWYKNIPVLYDVFNDLMVAESRNRVNYILRDDKLSDVYFLNHHFTYVYGDAGNGLKSGYYDELYSGKLEVFVKRIKIVNNSVSSQSVEVIYKDNSDIYIKKDGKYFSVNSKGAVLDILKDKKRELKQYLTNNNMKFNKDKEGSVASLARYYDQITH